MLLLVVVVVVRCRRDRMRLCWDREGSIDADTSAHTKTEARANKRGMVAGILFVIVMIREQEQKRERCSNGYPSSALGSASEIRLLLISFFILFDFLRLSVFRHIPAVFPSNRLLVLALLSNSVIIPAVCSL